MITRMSLRHAAATIVIASTLIAGCGAKTPEALLTSAKQYLANNDNKAAVIQLKNALQQNPNLAEARFLLGKALFDADDVVAAEKELRKAQELNYPADEVIPLLARSLAALGQYQKILDDYTKVTLASPSGVAQLQAVIGEAHLAMGKIDAGRDAFAKALAAEPNHVPARLGQARIAAGAGDLGRALGIVDAALAISPNNHHAWHLKGDILLLHADPEFALNAYRKAVEVKSDFLSGHWSLVWALLQQKNLEDATKQLEALKKVAPKHPHTLYLQALVAYRQNNFTAARAAIQQQLRAIPDNLQGLLLAGGIDFELKAYKQSEAHLVKVLRREPGQDLARRILVSGYLRTGQIAKALETLKPVLHRIEKNSMLLALAGEVYMMNGEPSLAADYFAKAAALDPGDSGKRTALALSHMAKGETAKAIRELEEIAETDSGIRADLALISTHMLRREYDKALAAIDALEKKQPASPVPENLRAAALLGKGDATGARRSLERALVRDHNYFPAIMNLARLDVADKKPEVAQKRFEAVLAKDPRHLQALLALADLRARSGGAPTEVVALITKAISAHPTDPVPRLALIGYYSIRKDTNKAVVASQEAMAAVPDQLDILVAAGRAHQVAGDTNQALAIYGKLVSLQPRSPEHHVRLAEAHLAAKNTTSALESLRQALTITPDFLDAQRAIIALDLDAGRLKEAVARAREVQKQRPKESVGYMFEGDIHAARKNWSEAVSAYRSGLKQASSTDLAVRLHTALRLDGGGKRAEEFAVAWLKDHPKDDGFRVNLAQVALAGKDYASAAQHYRKVLDSQPDNAAVLNNLAWVSGQLKDPKAIEHAEKANKLAPDQPAIMDTLGVLLMEKGDIARGLELLQKASAMAPQAAAIRLNLARGLIKAGKKDAAKKELDELAKLGDKFSDQAEVARLRQGL